MAKVLFQAMNPQLFRTTFIGYLYEIAQKHQVVLLVEEIDSYTKKLLDDKDLFPGLENIVFLEQPFHGNIFSKNYRLCKIVKETVQNYNPDVVIAHTDIWPADMYVLRFAKRAKAATIAIQAGFKMVGERKLYVWSSLMNAHLKMPRFLPFPVRLLFVKIKKYIGHFFYYWILPLTVGEKPFWGKTSFVFWDETSGLRDADYSAVFSKRDYGLCIKDGVKPEKLFVIGHPLEHEHTRIFFEKAYFSRNRERAYLPPGAGESPKTLTIMWSNDKIGFHEQDYSLIPEKDMQENKVRVVKLISEKLADWKIFIKPHPSIKSTSEIKEFLGQISKNVSIVHPSESADIYIEMSNVIVGMPPPSTTLFTASKQNPPKTVLSVNLTNEFLGDTYKDFPGIEYIDMEEKLIAVLNSIQNGTYQKQNTIVSNFDFTNTAELVDYVYDKRIY